MIVKLCSVRASQVFVHNFKHYIFISIKEIDGKIECYPIVDCKPDFKQPTRINHLDDVVV